MCVLPTIYFPFFPIWELIIIKNCCTIHLGSQSTQIELNIYSLIAFSIIIIETLVKFRNGGNKLRRESRVSCARAAHRQQVSRRQSRPTENKTTKEYRKEECTIQHIRIDISALLVIINHEIHSWSVTNSCRFCSKSINTKRKGGLQFSLHRGNVRLNI
jgi:hypothetical protein